MTLLAPIVGIITAEKEISEDARRKIAELELNLTMQHDPREDGFLILGIGTGEGRLSREQGIQLRDALTRELDRPPTASPR